MKVAFISESFTPETNSAAVQLDCLKREFEKNGDQVKVFTTKHSQRDESECIEQVSVPLRKSRNLFFRTLGELLLSPFFLFAFYKKINIFKPDLIVFYSPSIFFGLFISLIKKRSKTILIVRDIFPEWAFQIGLIKSKIILNFFKFFSSLQYKVADYIAYESEENIKHLNKYNVNRKLFKLENWLDEKKKYKTFLHTSI